MSPRSRKDPALAWLPPRVYVGKSAYEWHPPWGGAVRLAALNAKRTEVLAAYEAALEKREGAVDPHTVEAMARAYFASHEFLELAPATRKAYRRQWNVVRPKIGPAHAKQIKIVHVRKLIDRVRDEAKGDGAVWANRVLAFIKTMWEWGAQRGYSDTNPARGVRRFRETPRDRYVTDEEYRLLLAHCPPMIRAAVEITYRCMARSGDVVKLAATDIRREGILIVQSKTNRKQIKAWTNGLRAAVALAKEHAHPDGITIIQTQRGKPYTQSGLYQAVQRARRQAGLDPFTLHDIGAKGVTDFPGTHTDKAFAAGKSVQMVRRTYDRLPNLVETVTDLPNAKPGDPNIQCSDLDES